MPPPPFISRGVMTISNFPLFLDVTGTEEKWYLKVSSLNFSKKYLRDSSSQLSILGALSKKSWKGLFFLYTSLEQSSETAMNFSPLMQSSDPSTNFAPLAFTTDNIKAINKINFFIIT